MGLFKRKPSLDAVKKEAKELKIKNLKQNMLLTNYLDTKSAIRTNRAIALRKGHMARVAKLPFFKELFSSTQEIILEGKGKEFNFTVFRRGFGKKGSGKEAVAAVDDLGRSIIMMKFLENGKYAWHPAQIGMAGTKERPEWIFKQQNISGYWYGVYSALGDAIESIEHEIKFNPKWGFRKMKQVKDYL